MTDYQYVLELCRRQPREHLAAVAVKPDWEPAMDWARFTAFRARPSKTFVLENSRGWIEPAWDAVLGSPFLVGVNAMVPQDGGSPAVFDIPITYFGDLAQAASSDLIAEGKLVVGELFEYLVCAYARHRKSTADQESRPTRFSVRPAADVVHLHEEAIEDFFGGATSCGIADDDQMPVFLPQAILDETVELMNRAGSKETGGILVGHLHRDAVRGTVFLEVTAQIPAQHVLREATRLTFTPDTWAALDAAMALRRQGEMMVGWWHTHPSSAWCQDCPPDKRSGCKLNGCLTGDFFSSHDVALQRAVFPRAYSIALVLSDSCQPSASLVCRLYGWDQGMMADRGFHILAKTRGRCAAAVR
jgi:proteasome lid subunit RPN8/RPN11